MHTQTFINIDDLTDERFVEMLAERVAEKIKARSEAESTRELSDSEAARILRRSVSTVRKWKKEGRINSVQKGGIRVVRMCDVLGVRG